MFYVLKKESSGLEILCKLWDAALWRGEGKNVIVYMTKWEINGVADINLGCVCVQGEVTRHEWEQLCANSWGSTQISLESVIISVFLKKVKWDEGI